MNFGPLEFAAYLTREESSKAVSPAVHAARAAARTRSPSNALSILAGPARLPEVARVAQVEAVSVYEALASGADQHPGAVNVSVRPTARPVVLVLSSHRTVQWRLDVQPGAQLMAVLLAGYGQSTVAGAGAAMISSIGGFYAFKRGSAEFRHLEREVLRCTGRTIEHFQGSYAGETFEIGD